MHNLFLLFIATALAPFAANAAPPEKAVEAMPVSSAEQKLKKAVLLWAAEEAKAFQAVGRPEDAAALLKAIELTENGRTLRLVRNPKSTAETHTAKLDWQGPIQLHRSGEEFRPAWIGEDGKESLANPPKQIASGDVAIEIPAGAHVVLENQQTKPQ